jgi:hypothetical protein
MYTISAERLIHAQGRHFMPGAGCPPLGRLCIMFSCDFVLLLCS